MSAEVLDAEKIRRQTQRGAWRVFPCGCERDDLTLSPKHVKSDTQSAGDKAQGLHHYPEGKAPDEWCLVHSTNRPCRCDETKKKKKQPNKHKVKGKKR